MAGMPPSTTLQVTDEGATQLDKIGVMLDRELTFRDERDYPSQLKQMFPGKQPVVLMLGYYSCPAMCGQVLDAAFADNPERFRGGRPAVNTLPQEVWINPPAQSLLAGSVAEHGTASDALLSSDLEEKSSLILVNELSQCP